jgi:lipopolysaccharide/colanic/teichoic acid biosynthesis glycosyltransferase
MKRTVDFTVAAVGLLVLAPLLLLVSLLIRLDSKGPILFSQERLGRDGRCFRILKFRTMHVGAHRRLREVLERDPAAREEYELYAKLKDDPRITRMGRVLRRCSLDELPQLFNVLRGHMSLVGPRAYLPEELPKMVGKHQSILHVLPGITGLWQVSGRNELPFAMRLDLDLRYVRNWSVSLDLYLLARTLPTVLLRRGAG